MNPSKPTITVNGRPVGFEQPPYIIAEMACAHDGKFEQAKGLITAAKEAGADAVQLQFFVPESTVTPHHEVYPVLVKIAFTTEQWRSLFAFAKQCALDVWVCTYDMPSVRLAVELKADGIKLNSADLSNPQILKAVAESKIPCSIGTGASTVEEIRAAIEIFKTVSPTNFILMHGVQNFPTAVENLNIARLEFLRIEFPEHPVGYADHTDAEDPFAHVVDLMAVGAGASLLEKHIVLDRSAKGIDHQAALEPLEFRNYVNLLRTAFKAYGNNRPRPFSESDLKYRKFQKKSIVAARTIMPGEKIQPSDLLFLRNVTPGLAPSEVDLVTGKKAKRQIEKYENVQTEDLL